VPKDEVVVTLAERSVNGELDLDEVPHVCIICEDLTGVLRVAMVLLIQEERIPDAEVGTTL
jgi:hypothetical protein